MGKTKTVADDSDTPIIPGSSYGVEKTIGELYAYDYGRKGYLDTRSCRLPTVAIRTGAVSLSFLQT